MRAFCPRLHLPDAYLFGGSGSSGSGGKKGGKKDATHGGAQASTLRVGQKLELKAWQVKPDGSIIVTGRRALLDESRHVLLTHEDATPGRVAVGMVTQISPQGGLVVYFYNGIRGMLLYSLALNEQCY